MGWSKKIDYSALDVCDAEQVINTIELLSVCFSDRERYTVKRLTDELTLGSVPFYKQFFIVKDQGAVIGVGGVKAADWASDTHVLYLSAVAPKFRGRGIGKALVKLRLDWLKRHYESGRVLVSTQKIERFKSFGFKQTCNSSNEGHVIMLKEF